MAFLRSGISWVPGVLPAVYYYHHTVTRQQQLLRVDFNFTVNSYCCHRTWTSSCPSRPTPYYGPYLSPTPALVTHYCHCAASQNGSGCGPCADCVNTTSVAAFFLLYRRCLRTDYHDRMSFSIGPLLFSAQQLYKPRVKSSVKPTTVLVHWMRADSQANGFLPFSAFLFSCFLSHFFPSAAFIPPSCA